MSDEHAPPIQEAMRRVMETTGAVGKHGEVNTRSARYSFRGIDDVMAAVQPALIEHGVIVTPEVIEHDSSIIEREGRAAMFRVLMRVRFTFTGPAGDSISCVTAGEALDTSDKASNKAMSAAAKYALTLSLSIPVEGDPHDSERPEPGEGKMIQHHSRSTTRSRGDSSGDGARECGRCGGSLAGEPAKKANGVWVHVDCAGD